MSIIDVHIAHLRLANRRPSTLSHRRRVLTQFQRHVDPKNLLSATRPDVLEFLGRPLAPESRRAYRGHLRQFYLWARDEDMIAADPTEKVPGVRVPRRLPRPVAADQVTLALACAPQRMRAWLLLMILAGLRCMEVAALMPSDVILEPTPVLLLRETKGGNQQTVPVHPQLVEELLALPIRSGAWWTVSPNHVSAEVSRYLHSLGIDATAHRLRHSFGTLCYGVDHDLLTTQRLLRHASVSSTQVYADLAPLRPAEVLAAVDLSA